MDSKSDQIWSKHRHIHVINLASINNLASNHLDFHDFCQNEFQFKIKTLGLKAVEVMLLMQINTRILVYHT